MLIPELCASIERYCATGQPLEFKNIIQTMQDTFSIGNSCPIKNGFNALRNVAVHETEDFCQAYNSVGNAGQSVFVFRQKTFRWANIIYCLLHAYISSKQQYYLQFAKGILKWRLGYVMEMLPYRACHLIKPLSNVVYQLGESGCIAKQYNAADQYMNKLAESNPSSFLLRTVPMPEPVLAYACKFPDSMEIILELLLVRGCF